MVQKFNLKHCKSNPYETSGLIQVFWRHDKIDEQI